MSLQPSGFANNSYGNDTNSGNPSYTDASAGPSTSPVPNAKPHAMDQKKKKKPKIEGKVFSPEEAGYVDSPTPKQCQTCEYFQDPNICMLPMNQPVCPVNGCCDFWKDKNANNGQLEKTTVSRRFCRSCSKAADEKTVTCPDCGSMEWTDKPMSKFTLANGY